MKTNNKAFTLVEIIGVITILSLILLISLPAITSTLKRNEQKKYNDYVNDLKIAAESYIVKNINKYPELNVENGGAYLQVTTLLKEGYIDKIQLNPNTNSNDENILITKNSDGTFNFELVQINTLKDAVYNDLRSDLCTDMLLSNCYYISDDSNNYVWYGGFLWRILGLDNSGNVEMITEDNITTLSAGSNDAYTWMNDYEFGFKESLPSYLKSLNFSLIHEDKYKNSNIEFLKNTGSILVQGTDKEIWYSSDGNSSNSYQSGGVRPVTIIPGTIKLASGIGSEDLPYTLENDTASDVGSYITNLKVGEYIKLVNRNNIEEQFIVKIVSKDDAHVKVLFDLSFNYNVAETDLNNVYAELSSSDSLSYYFDLKTNSWKVSKLVYDENNDYYGIDYSNLFVIDNQLNVGILYAGEMFASYNDGISSFVSCSGYNGFSCIVGESGVNYVSNVGTNNYRPVAFLNPTLKITSGNGTINNPYTVSY